MVSQIWPTDARFWAKIVNFGDQIWAILAQIWRCSRHVGQLGLKIESFFGGLGPGPGCIVRFGAKMAHFEVQNELILRPNRAVQAGPGILGSK